MLIAVAGIIIGFVAGHLARHGNDDALCEVLQLSLPGLQPKSGGLCALPAGVTYGRAVLGAVKAVREVAWLSPAVAMSPARPAAVPQGAGRPHRSVRASCASPASSSMRHLTHWPLRTASGILGMALAVADAGGLALVLRLDRPHDRRHLPPQRPAGRHDHLHRSEVRWRACYAAQPASRRLQARALPRGWR